MLRWLTILLLSASFEAQAFFFPEIPFCPLGGPPGWANRIMNDDYYRYPPPPRYYRPAYQSASPYPRDRELPPPWSRNACGGDGSSCPFGR